MKNLLWLVIAVASILITPNKEGFSQTQTSLFWHASGSNTIWFEIRQTQVFYEVKEYIWHFGDGTIKRTRELRLPHVYPAPGQYYVMVKAVTYSGIEYLIVERWIMVPSTVVVHTIDFSKIDPSVQIVLILSIAAVLIVAMIYGYVR